MLFKLEPRGTASKLMVYTTPILAVFLTLVTSSVLLALSGFEPLKTLQVFFLEPLSTRYGLAELGVKATPLILIGLGLSLGFRANVWNIGAEGQLTMGAIAGGGIALYFYESESTLVLPAMLIAGALGGMAWAAIPAFLKTRFNTNEILTSLMLTYIALLLLSLLVNGPWRDPDGYNFPESRLFSAASTLPVIWEGTRLHLGAVIALLVVVVLWFVLSRSLFGFQVKVVGLAPAAAGYAGFSQKKVIWLTLLIGGALAGMAGLIEVSGPIGQLLPNISPGYGFTAIIVAFLGRLHPVGVVLAGLLMALTYLGGETVQIEMGLPVAMTGVIQGMLLFFLLASDVLILYRFRFFPSRQKKTGERK